VRAPEWLYSVLGLTVILAVIGLGVGVWRSRRDVRAALRAHLSLFILAAWIGIIFLALVQWMIQVDAPYGRLLFPALPAIAPLLVIGWMQLIPSPAKPLVLRAVPIPLLLVALAAP